MTFHSFDDIDDAIAATRAFLWPFDLGRWLKLAFVVFFLGGTGGASPMRVGGDVPRGGTPGSPGTGLPGDLPSFTGIETTILAALLGILLLVVLGFVLVSAVMEFVFVESLRRERVAIRRYWSERWMQGVRLFGFRVAVGLLSLLVLGGLLGLALAPALLSDGSISVGLLAVAVPVFLLLALVSGLVNGFTTSFVVPVMIGEERTLLSAWRRFWPTLRSAWKEYTVYAVMRFVLQIAAGILVAIVTVLALLVVAIPLAIVAGIGVALLSVVEVAGIAIVAIAAVLFVLCALVISLFAAVPVQTFLHYYALFVLGDTNDAFDLVPEQRRAVREEA